MKVTVSYDPQDHKEVMNALDLVAPDKAHLGRARIIQLVRDYAKRVKNDECGIGIKDVGSYVDSKLLIRKI